MYMTQPDRQRIQHIRDYCEEVREGMDDEKRKKPSQATCLRRFSLYIV